VRGACYVLAMTSAQTRLDAIELLINAATSRTPLGLAATAEALRVLDVDEGELDELGVLEQLDGEPEPGG
jgi:hypothetical protein